MSAPNLPLPAATSCVPKAEDTGKRGCGKDEFVMCIVSRTPTITRLLQAVWRAARLKAKQQRMG